MSHEAKRRRNQQGAVYKTTAGWRGAVDLGWIDGKRRRKYVHGKSRTEVLAKLRPLVDAARTETLTATRSPRVDEWLETYLTEVAALSVRPSTLQRYRQEVRLYIGPALGNMSMEKVKPHHVAAFYRKQLEHLAPSSVRRLHALLRRSFSVALKWGVVASNPITQVEAPPLQHFEIEPLHLNEVRVLLRTSAGTAMHARWLIAATLGLRQGEVLGLRWSDIDLEVGQLRVRQSLQRQDGGLSLVPPKTPRSRRTIPLPRSIIDALRALEQSQADRRDAAGEAWQDSGLVFTTRTGGPIHPRNDYRTFQALLKKAGLRRVRLHDLRHTAASLLLEQGVHPRVVMEILGHSQISLTMNTYSHVVPDTLRSATDSVQEALWNLE